MKKRRPKSICWVCLKSWKSKESQICGNKNCSTTGEYNKILKTCDTKTIENISNVPIYRACPNCYTLIEHRDACRHMTCIVSKCRS